MADSDSNPDPNESHAVAICIAVVTTIFIPAFIFLMHQTFYLTGPRCHLQLLYVPALDLAAPPPPEENSTNPFLFFDLSFINIQHLRGITYGDINLTFFYGHKAVAHYVIPSFYQGGGRTARRRDVVETAGLPWVDAVAAVSSGSTAGFRVEVAARPRFRNFIWNTNPKKVDVGADVEVDGKGVKAVEDDIKLTSDASSRYGGIRVYSFVVMSLIVSLQCCVFSSL